MKLATFNIHFAIDSPINVIDQYLNRFNLDIVGLQEVNEYHANTFRFSWNIVHIGEIALLSKYPINEVSYISLDVGDLTDNRYAISGTINGLKVMLTHLDHRYESLRMKQIEILRPYLKNIDILLGDLNSIAYGDLSDEEIRKQNIERVAKGIELIHFNVTSELSKYFDIPNSSPTTPYRTCVDYILFKRGLSNSQVTVDRSIDKRISDHNLVIRFLDI